MSRTHRLQWSKPAPTGTRSGGGKSTRAEIPTPGLLGGKDLLCMVCRDLSLLTPARGLDLGPGGPGYPPPTGLVAPPPLPDRTPAWGLRGGAPGLLPGGMISYRGGSKLGSPSLWCMNLFGCRSPAEAGDRLDGRPRFERAALAPCSRRESNSGCSPPPTAGSRCDCPLLSARAARDSAPRRAVRMPPSATSR